MVIAQNEPSTPQQIHEAAVEQANFLMKLVRNPAGRGKYVMKIGGNEFLRYEAWVVIARFNHCHPIVEWTKPILDGSGETVAYEARANVVRTSNEQIVSTAEAMCGLEENVARSRGSKYAKHNAARSMAQTRAAAKALRMIFSYVVVMEGFSPNVAEEIGDMERRPVGDEDGGFVVGGSRG